MTAKVYEILHGWLMTGNTVQAIATRFLAKRWKFLVLIIMAVVIVYAQSMTYQFVTYDDYDLVSRNEEFLQPFSNIVTAFATHAFTTHRSSDVYYRPLLLVSFILDYHVWGLNPLGFHLMNVLLHCLNAILVFVLCSLIFQNDLLALAAALLFALHPVQVQAVAWVSGRNDLLLGFFIILMITSYIAYRKRDGSHKYYLVITIISFTLALFTKEPAAFFFLLIPLYDLCLGSPRPSLRHLLSRIKSPAYFLPLLILAGYFVIRLRVFGTLIGTERLYGQNPMIERFIQVPAIVSEFSSFILFPIHLSITHPLSQLVWMRQPWESCSFVILSAIVIAALWSWKKDRTLCFGLSWFIVGLLPTLNIIPVAVPILEHRLYAAIPGIGIIVVRTSQLLMTSNFRKKIVWGSLIIIIVGCAVISSFRLPVWRGSDTLWSDAIEKEPTDSHPYFDLAGYYFELKDFDRTIDLLHVYLGLEPNDLFAYSKLREAYFLSGRYSESAGICRKMIELDPTNPGRYVAAGLLYTRLNYLDSALELFHQGLQVDSNSYTLHYNVALLYARLKDTIRAERHLLRSVELNPKSAEPYFALGTIYYQRNDDERAIRAIEEGVKIGHPPLDELNFLLFLYHKTDRIEQAQHLAIRFGLKY